jgi:hypothetical protein
MRGRNVFSPSVVRSSAVVDLSPNAWAAGPAQAQVQENCGSSGARGAVRAERSGLRSGTVSYSIETNPLSFEFIRPPGISHGAFEL